MRLPIFVVLAFWSSVLWGQPPQIDLFPGIQGTALLDSLAKYYSVQRPFTYDVARDTLFGRVENLGGQLYCIYTRHSVPMPADQDPTIAAFQNGAGMNTEHTWPQNFGTEFGTARADMHHLYPTRVLVNGKRGDFAFAEVNDSQVREWYFKTQALTSAPPLATRDSFSELGTSTFEPREAAKGNIARSMFYIYAIYKSQLNTNFWEQQRATLCRWNFQDPVDAQEYERSRRVALHQGNMNPFVMDCTLAQRCVCEDQTFQCTVSAPGADVPQPDKAYFDGQFLQWSSEVPLPRNTSFAVLDITGRALLQGELRQGDQRFAIAAPEMPGIYFLVLQHATGRSAIKLWVW